MRKLRFSLTRMTALLLVLVCVLGLLPQLSPPALAPSKWMTALTTVSSTIPRPWASAISIRCTLGSMERARWASAPKREKGWGGR